MTVWKSWKRWRKNYPDIEQAGIVVSKEEMGKLGVLAWDAGRLNFISRLCLEQEYIVKEECMQRNQCRLRDDQRSLYQLERLCL